MIDIQTIITMRRDEIQAGGITKPPANLIQDIEAYMQDAVKKSGPATMWDPDCDILAAMEALEEYFEQRRIKLTLCARDNDPPERGHLLPFESEAFDALQKAHQDLVTATMTTIRPRAR